MTSTPLKQMHALPNQPFCQPELGTISTPRFFATRMPRYPIPLVPRPNAPYNVPTPGFYNHRVSPPIQIHPNHRYRSHSALGTLPPPLPITIVSPHIAGWMNIADDVVGPHPFAKPLFERVASQAEIDLISDHVQIGWIHNGRQSKPHPVTVSGPAHDIQKGFGHLVPSTSAVNTRGRFLLGDDGPNRFEHHVSHRLSPVVTRQQDQNTRRSS